MPCHIFQRELSLLELDGPEGRLRLLFVLSSHRPQEQECIMSSDSSLSLSRTHSRVSSTTDSVLNLEPGTTANQTGVRTVGSTLETPLNSREETKEEYGPKIS